MKQAKTKMIFLIHGDNPLLVKQKLDQLTGKFQNGGKKILRINAKKLADINIRQILSEKNLFGEETVLVISDVSSLSGKKIKNLTSLIGKSQRTAIFWNNNEIKAKTVIGLFPRQNVFNFPVPKTIFKFLESIGGKNQNFTIGLLEKTFARETEGMIFYWLKRHFREIFLFIIGSASADKIADWKKNKIKNQIKTIGREQSLALYQDLIEIEFRQKTGRLPEGLKIAIANRILKA